MFCHSSGIRRSSIYHCQRADVTGVTWDSVGAWANKVLLQASLDLISKVPSGEKCSGRKCRWHSNSEMRRPLGFYTVRRSWGTRWASRMKWTRWILARLPFAREKCISRWLESQFKTGLIRDGEDETFTLPRSFGLSGNWAKCISRPIYDSIVELLREHFVKLCMHDCASSVRSVKWPIFQWPMEMWTLLSNGLSWNKE